MSRGGLSFNMANPITEALIGTAVGSIDKVLSRFFPNKDDKQKAMFEIQNELTKQEGELAKAVMEIQKAQLEINKAEAQSASLFVAGWRPSVGWVCSFGLAWACILQPFIVSALVIYSKWPEFKVDDLPRADMATMMPVLVGMLGMGGLRTVEKIKGEVDRSSLKEA